MLKRWVSHFNSFWKPKNDIKSHLSTVKMMFVYFMPRKNPGNYTKLTKIVAMFERKVQSMFAKKNIESKMTGEKAKTADVEIKKTIRIK